MKPSQVWKNYWKSERVREDELCPRLNLFQIAVYSVLKKIIKENNLESILSAGSGQDVISFNLQKYFKNKLKITILDISEEVLSWNEKLFNKYNLNAKFLKTDIFRMPFDKNSFDLVFNTGVLEHLERDEQVQMTKEILRVLKPNGYFLTANPSDRGWIYKLGMETAKKKGIWPFGTEIPVTTLKFLEKEISEIAYIKEQHKDFLSQLNFLCYLNPAYKITTIPMAISARLFYRFQFATKLCDFLFSKKFGTYLIISVIKKK